MYKYFNAEKLWQTFCEYSGLMTARFQDPLQVLWLILHSWSLKTTNFEASNKYFMSRKVRWVYIYYHFYSMKMVNQPCSSNTIYFKNKKMDGSHEMQKRFLTFGSFYWKCTFLRQQHFLLPCTFPVNSVLSVVVQIPEIRVFNELYIPFYNYVNYVAMITKIVSFFPFW